MSEAEQQLIEEDIEEYLKRHEAKTLLRFVIVGSVDDGKSTLIGRMLFDTNTVYEDQMDAVKAASKMEDGAVDLSLITDGLAAEREQGITIDVAYRYFTTEKRKFIVADTPGHVQYTRNMVTGASTANVGVILVDARLGILEQSRRHAYIASLLGIPRLLVCINKMDLTDYSSEVYETIKRDFESFAGDLSFRDVTFIPVSALKGDNVVHQSDKTPWYDGPTVLGFLETVPIAEDRNLSDFRFPVQYVLRPNLDYRGFSGQVASGIVKKGDEVVVLPSGKTSRVKAINVFEGELEEAFAPLSVTLLLEDEIDCSRGEMITHVDNRPQVSRSFDADLVWMDDDEHGLDTEKSYIIKHGCQTVRAQLDKIHARVNLDTLKEEPAETLHLNDIAYVHLTCHRALYWDPYSDNRATGCFVVVDSLTNNTVGAGMIRSVAREQNLEQALKEIRAGSGLEPKTQVSPRERRRRFGQSGATVWLTGLPGSGRWALAYALERRLFDLGKTAHVLDPFREDLGAMISAARACTNAGLITIAAFPSYKRAQRARVRERVGEDRFFEIFVDTDLAICRERRPQANFDGFEAPESAALTIHLDRMLLEKAVDRILEALNERDQFEE